MIIKSIITIVVFLVAYGTFLISNVPSGWLVSRLNPQLAAAHASLSDTRGGAWTGSGQLAVNGTPLGRLSWDADFWPLLTGHLDADVKLQGNDIRARARVKAQRKSVRMTNLKGQADLQMLARLAHLPPEAQGTLVADIKLLQVTPQGAIEAARGNVNINGTRLPDLGVDLGTLHLILRYTGPNQGIQGAISNDGGDLDISGQLHLYHGNRYSLLAYLKPHPGSKNDPMRDALAAMLGKPDRLGRYQYRVNGILSR